VESRWERFSTLQAIPSLIKRHSKWGGVFIMRKRRKKAPFGEKMGSDSPKGLRAVGYTNHTVSKPSFQKGNVKF
jgi:hypothetical protein